MPSKIIFTVTNDLTYDQRMIRICSTLANHGFEVLLVGRTKPNSIPLQTQPFQQHRFNLWFNKGKLFYLAYNIRLFFFLLFNRFDSVGSIDLDTLLPCYLGAKIKGKPIIFDAHEYFTEVPEVINRPLTKSIWTFLGNWLIPKVDAAYTVSASLQDLFSKKYGIPFGLIRNISARKGLPKIESQYSSIPPRRVLLYQGVLNEGRGLEALIHAMPSIDKAELWLAGEGDLSASLRQLVTDLKIENRVVFLGYLLPDALAKVTAQATIGLNLLENRGLSYYYSLANKTFDYIHAGLPAIHLAFPEYCLINEQLPIGILVPDLKTTTLVEAIQQLLNDPILYQQLQDNCEQAKSVYNWEQEAKRLIHIYQSIHNL
ncbi:MAG: glycosyltransferase [Saprospiraceae bacterium]